MLYFQIRVYVITNFIMKQKSHILFSHGIWFSCKCCLKESQFAKNSPGACVWTYLAIVMITSLTLCLSKWKKTLQSTPSYGLHEKLFCAKKMNWLNLKKSNSLFIQVKYHSFKVMLYVRPFKPLFLHLSLSLQSCNHPLWPLTFCLYIYRFNALWIVHE